MQKPLNVVALSGSTFLPSRTLALAQAIVDTLAQSLHIRSQVIHLGEIARSLGASLGRSELPAQAEAQLQAIENADFLIIATPVYRGGLPGHLKHLVDLLGLESLMDRPVLLAATGGSDRHTLVIDHQLRPLLSFMQALTLPVGVYGTNADFNNYQVHSEALHARIHLAVDRALVHFESFRLREEQGATLEDAVGFHV